MKVKGSRSGPAMILLQAARVSAGISCSPWPSNRTSDCFFGPPVTGSFLIPECQWPQLWICVVLCSDWFCLVWDVFMFLPPRGCAWNVNKIWRWLDFRWSMILVLYNSLEGKISYKFLRPTWLCGWSQVTYRSRSCVIPNLSCEGTWAGMDWCQDTQGKVTSLGPRLIDQIWPWEETVSTVPSLQSWMFTANYCQIRDTVANPYVSYQAKQVYPGVGGCKEFQVKGQLAVPDHISPRCPVP